MLHELQERVDNPDETDDVLCLGLHRLPITQFPDIRSRAELANYDAPPTRRRTDHRARRTAQPTPQPRLTQPDERDSSATNHIAGGSAPCGPEVDRQLPEAFRHTRSGYQQGAAPTPALGSVSTPPRPRHREKCSCRPVAFLWCVVQYSGATMRTSLAHAADLAAIDPNDPTAFQTFRQFHEQPAGLAEGYGVLAGMNTQLDPAIMAAVREIPACKPLGL